MTVPRPYRSLLLTYPAHWRRRYADDVLTTLLELHAESGRRTPSPTERLRFFADGLRRRLAQEPRLQLPPLIAPGHRFDQTNGMIVEREPTAHELVHARWWDQEPTPSWVPVGMVGGRPSAVAR